MTAGKLGTTVGVSESTVVRFAIELGYDGYPRLQKELREVKKKYANARLTTIEDEIEEIKIDTKVLVAQEDVIVSVTKEGYVKRTSLRSYSASKPEEIGMREGD